MPYSGLETSALGHFREEKIPGYIKIKGTGLPQLEAYV